MEEREFTEVIPGIISTTGRDRHGHAVPREELERWAEQIRSAERAIPLTVHHDSDEVHGEWVYATVEDFEEYAALVAVAGIYEGHEDVIDRIDDGEFGGMSITAGKFLNTTKSEWGQVEETTSVVVDGAWAAPVTHIVTDSDVSCRFEIQKSAVGGAFFEFAADNLDYIVELAIILYVKWQSQGDEQEESDGDDEPGELREPELVLPDGGRITLSGLEPAEIVVELRSRGYEVTPTPEQAEALAEVIDEAWEEGQEE